MINFRTIRSTMLALITVLVFEVGTDAHAQMPHRPSYASVGINATPMSLSAGKTGKLVIHMQIKPGFHINSAKPKDPDLIATEFLPTPVSGVHFGAPKYPREEIITTAASPAPISVYTGSVNVIVPFTVDASAKKGSTNIGGTLTYQGCNATACFPPKQSQLAVKVVVK